MSSLPSFSFLAYAPRRPENETKQKKEPTKKRAEKRKDGWNSNINNETRTEMHSCTAWARAIALCGPGYGSWLRLICLAPRMKRACFPFSFFFFLFPFRGASAGDVVRRMWLKTCHFGSRICTFLVSLFSCFLFCIRVCLLSIFICKSWMCCFFSVFFVYLVVEVLVSPLFLLWRGSLTFFLAS